MGARGRVLAVVARVAIVLVCLQLQYLMVANASLACGPLRGAPFGSPENFWLDYDGIYTLVPGVVHVRGLHIRAQDSSIQWTLDIDRARFVLSPLPLLGRVARLEGIRATGVVFRIRHKGDPLESTPQQTALLVHIPGYADPPVREATVPPPPRPLDELWRVQLVDVHAQVREIWIQELRFVGDGRLTSPRGMNLKLGGHDLTVGQTTLAVRSGSMLLGPSDVLTRRLVGRFVVTLHTLDLGVPHGSDIFRHFTAAIRVRGDLARMAALDYYLREVRGVHVVGGEGDYDANLLLRRGVLGVGSHAVGTARDLAVSLDGTMLRANAASRLTIDDPREGVVSMGLTRFRLSPHGSPGAPIWSDRVDLEARLQDLALASHFSDTILSLSMPHAQVPGVATIAPLMPTKVRLQEGEVSFHDVKATYATRPGKGTASGRMRAARMVLRIDGTRFRGNLGAAMRVALGAAKARGTGVIETDGVRVGDDDDDDDDDVPLSGRLDASSLSIDGDEVTSPVSFRLRNADGLAEMILKRVDGPLPSFVTDWLDHEDVRGRATMSVRPPVVAIEALDLRGDNYRLRGRFRFGPGHPNVRALVQSGPLSVGVGVARGDTDIVLFGSTSWFLGR